MKVYCTVNGVGSRLEREYMTSDYCYFSIDSGLYICTYPKINLQLRKIWPYDWLRFGWMHCALLSAGSYYGCFNGLPNSLLFTSSKVYCVYSIPMTHYSHISCLYIYNYRDIFHLLTCIWLFIGVKKKHSANPRQRIRENSSSVVVRRVGVVTPHISITDTRI